MVDRPWRRSKPVPISISSSKPRFRKRAKNIKHAKWCLERNIRPVMPYTLPRTKDDFFRKRDDMIVTSVRKIKSQTMKQPPGYRSKSGPIAMDGKKRCDQAHQWPYLGGGCGRSRAFETHRRK